MTLFGWVAGGRKRRIRCQRADPRRFAALAFVDLTRFAASGQVDPALTVRRLVPSVSCTAGKQHLKTNAGAPEASVLRDCAPGLHRLVASVSPVLCGFSLLPA